MKTEETISPFANRPRRLFSWQVGDIP